MGITICLIIKFKNNNSGVDCVMFRLILNFSSTQNKYKMEHEDVISRSEEQLQDYSIMVPDNRANRMVWTNERESIHTTLHELSVITTFLDDLIKLCVKKKRHVVYHTLSFANELLKRRADYLQQICSDTFTMPSQRLTYPTCFLGEWLKYVAIKKKTTPSMCNHMCGQLFVLNGDIVVDSQTPDELVSYPLEPPFMSGPYKAAPKSGCNKKLWTDIYELKYFHLAVRNIIDGLIMDDDQPLKNVLEELSCLFLIRYKTKIGYTPGVGNDILKYNRHRFYKVYDDFKQFSSANVNG